MPYGPSRGITKEQLSLLVLRYLKDGGKPVDVAAALQAAMKEESTRLGLQNKGWDEAATWMGEVVSYLTGLER